MNDLDVSRCPLCGSQEAAIIHSVARAALQVALPQEAAPSDDDYAALRIVQCAPCGHIYNAAFDPSLSGKMYGDTFLTNTPVHVSMMDHLREIVEWIGDENFRLYKEVVSRFVETHAIGKRLVEVFPEIDGDWSVRTAESEEIGP